MQHDLVLHVEPRVPEAGSTPAGARCCMSLLKSTPYQINAQERVFLKKCYTWWKLDW